MEGKKVFVGIDFSKLTFDATIYNGEHCKFQNNADGYAALLSWTQKQTGMSDMDSCLFCGEHTGNYSLGLANYLYAHGCTVWLESPVRIKRSLGLARGKDDKTDSSHIARYASRNADDAVAYEPCSENIAMLRRLFSRRQLLVSLRTALKNSRRESQNAGVEKRLDKTLDRMAGKEIKMFDKDIASIERQMMDIVGQDEKLAPQYRHITSVKGVGQVNALALITVTEGFTKYNNSKALACHAGVAPFRRDSGTSVHGGSHVSHLSNHTLKPLLTQAALSAVRYDGNIAAYYHRLREKGKKPQVALNNVKNKLLHIIVALIRDDMDCQENYIAMNKIEYKTII